MRKIIEAIRNQQNFTLYFGIGNRLQVLNDNYTKAVRLIVYYQTTEGSYTGWHAEDIYPGGTVEEALAAFENFEKHGYRCSRGSWNSGNPYDKEYETLFLSNRHYLNSVA